jgi:hypothetical protein
MTENELIEELQRGAGIGAALSGNPEYIMDLMRKAARKIKKLHSELDGVLTNAEQRQPKAIPKSVAGPRLRR